MARHGAGLRSQGRRRSRTARAGRLRPSLTLIGAVAATLAVLLGPAVAGAAFSATTASPGNAWTAAAGFPDYPSAVIADHPLAYYRLGDPAGSVTATDSSGNGATGVYGVTDHFGWSGLWPMDENGGGTTRDLSAAAGTHDLTVHGAGWTPSGHSGSALSFDGSSAYAATSGAVVTTTSSFTVAAWVYLTDASTSRMAVSQDGGTVSGFGLGYDNVGNRWVFQLAETDSTPPTLVRVSSTAAPSLNTWTQLTATYDSATNGIDLYVNGVWQAHTVGALGGWTAAGALTVGAGYDAGRTDYWMGRVDEVRVLPALVDAAMARQLTLGGTGGAATNWQLDENGGTTAVDSAGHLNTGTLGSSATWAGGHSGASAIDLPGDINGYVAGSAPGVDTTTSFSVAAWVYLDHTTLNAMSRIAVSQSANIKSGFQLKYNHFGGGQWEFAVTRGPIDDYSPVVDSAYSAGGSVALTTWTHLVGVFDANAQTVTLYVNRVAQPSVGHSALFNATGPLQVGRVKEFGGWMDGSGGLLGSGAWSGRVDDVRVYRRALTPAEITSVYSGGDAGTTLGMPGALQGTQQGQTAATAMAFSSTARSSYDPDPYTDPTTYSLECWFRTRATPAGQTLISFSDSPDGDAALHDRRIFLDASGHVVAATGSGVANTARSGSSYADGAWHHLAATVTPAHGIRLYLDGTLSATAAYTAPGTFTGYWRWGGDAGDGLWPADYLALGELDEVAVYAGELTAQRIAVHYHANH